jgi:hypothetical protein
MGSVIHINEQLTAENCGDISLPFGVNTSIPSVDRALYFIVAG